MIFYSVNIVKYIARMFFLSSNDIIGQKKKIVIGNTKNHFLYGCAQFSIDTFVNIGMSICPQISIVYSSFKGGRHFW